MDEVSVPAVAPRAVDVAVTVVVLTAVACVGTVLGVVGVVPSDPALTIALALAMTIASVFTVWDFGRPRSCSLDLTELFVAIGLVLAAPGDLVLAVTVGSALVPWLRQRVGPLRGIPPRNRAVQAFAVAMPVARVTVALATTVASSGLLGRPLAAVLGITAMLAVDSLVAAVVVHLDAGVTLRGWLLREPALRYGLPLAAGVIGAWLGWALRGAAGVWAAVVALALMLLLASRAGTELSRERRRSDLLLRATRSAVATTAADDTAGAIARVVADGLHARRAAVVQTVPSWAVLSAPLVGHGWLVVGERAIATHAAYDRLDVELLEHLAELATVVLDNHELVDRLADRERVSAMLVATAAHDLRSPLAIAASAMETLRAHGAADASHADGMLDVGLRATDRASRLVHDLLVLERDRGPVGTADAVAQVGEVVDVVVAGLPAGDARRCRTSVHGDPVAAIAPVLLERVVDNLVRNALRHTPAGEEVEVRVHADPPGQVTLVVADHGPGVPAQLRASVFDAGTRGATGDGYGLGLHIASEFVRRAGGDLRVTDRQEGRGAAFVVRLPAA